MKKILFVIPSLSQTNGISAFLINYLKNINLRNFDITVVCSDYNKSENYTLFLEENNIKIYFLNNLKKVGIIKYIKSILSFFKKNHDYDLIYSNVANQSILFFLLGIRYKIKRRILHSHATVSSDKKIKKIINDLLIKIVVLLSTERVACTNEAGKAMFRKKDFIIIKNAINYDIFRFNEKYRKQIRDIYNINEKNILLGFVGRFVPQKNIFFFVKLAEILDNKYRIMMIGNGYQKIKFNALIEEKGLKNKFIIIEECSDVFKYYSAMDVFLLPSVYEGLGIVGIEAQVNGLNCLLSDTIPKDCKIINSTLFLPRNRLDLWKNELEKINYNYRKEIILNNDYDIQKQALIFENYLNK